MSFDSSSVDLLLESIVSTQLQPGALSMQHQYDSPIVLTPPCHNSFCSSKTEKTFALLDIEKPNIATLRDLKFYFQSKFSVKQTVSVGYKLNSRKVWIKTDEELADLTKTSLCRGKGSLWCEGVSTDIDDDDNTDHESPTANQQPTICQLSLNESEERLYWMKTRKGSRPI